MLVLSIVVSAFMLAVMFVNMHAFFKGRQEGGGTAHKQISFPIALEGTSLVAERLAAYDGPFIEDGTNDEVTGIAALVLRNAGAETVTQADILLEQGSQQLAFHADTIPPGMTVLVLEANRGTYSMTACTAACATAQTREYPKIPLDVEPCGLGILRETNPTQSPLYGICLYHKQWQDPPGILVGGIS